jgi:hypothetical protein
MPPDPNPFFKGRETFLTLDLQEREGGRERSILKGQTNGLYQERPIILIMTNVS